MDSGKSFEESLLQFVEELKDESEMTEKQRSIMQASIKLFATKGFHASSTAEIAKEAGVAEGTIFRHYKSKKDILLAVVAPVLVKIATPFILRDVREIFNRQKELSFGEILQELYQNRLSLVAANEKHVRILLQEAFFHDEIRETLLSTVFQEIKRLAAQLIKDRTEAGELRPLPSDAVFRAILSSLIGLVLFKHVTDPDEFAKRTDEEQVAATVDILLYGIANRP
ncbi:MULTISPECIES: TetR/AcrR family transcriptional regulator [Brevibacillus]|uniref:Transcriptional regulator n=1 Tax=Brevibacillus borstelensis AK1 TaxID=1300222 RepID=M8DTR9_9BACL|nr:TetR/AcrR family transcriptional regulator [Brevibacillus borstelensis]EMT50386.1 transcriptional regulator [Brevibacillus borstelensis AK1]KKX57055.1 transcriptional regulator [Brevibacillus borstelensis cifa_chp40]MBE5395792.1 TetR/AcrR family transcriptional regulator [Brevibacillus borstelensis]MCC0563927.1 TetR/AcrR family transcriptional regulator [Brevibacillus borstelensis]MCM3469958.1 TetR/AcrR family transcriptional regulator [Brevibacillus borstelensis]